MSTKFTPKPAWSASSLANAAGLTVNTVRSMARDGRIPAVRIGRDYRIPHDVAVAFVEGRQLPAQNIQGHESPLG